MERLLAVLAGLVLGLRGTRRKAFEVLLDGLRREACELRVAAQERDNVLDVLERVQNERDSALKGQVEERERADALQHRVEVFNRGCGDWRLVIRRRLLSSNKLQAIIALRHVTRLGLKEAKEWVEARTIGNGFKVSTLSDPESVPAGDDWVVLSDKIGTADLMLAIDTLFNCGKRSHNSTPIALDDVLFGSLADDFLPAATAGKTGRESK
jgi:hypothetical protein